LVGRDRSPRRVPPAADVSPAFALDGPFCYSQSVSLAEIKHAVETLSPNELAELASFIRERENVEWDRQIDADFDQDGRLRPVLEEVRENIRVGRLEELP